MSTPETPAWARGHDPRLIPLVTVVPYAILAALVAVTVVIRHGSGGSLLIDLGLCAATASWMLWMFTLHPAWRDSSALMGLFFAGLVVLIGVLVLRDPWFGLFTPAGYSYAFGFLPWPWRLPGVAVVALESGSAQASTIPRDSAVGLTAIAVVLAVNVICMCGFTWMDWGADRRNEERKAALEQAREANRRLLETLAENAGLHRQLLVQAREAGVLDERQRMAREIHDTLAQGLIGIITQLQAAEQTGAVPERWRAHCATATRLARESLAEARRSVDALRPQPLETAGLAEALAGVADRWSVLHGVGVEVTATGAARPMRPEAELALLRAAQEALANVARHARATGVTLSLGYLEDEVALDVCDDGCGFEVSAAATAVPARVGGAAVSGAAVSGAAVSGAAVSGAAVGGAAGPRVGVPGPGAGVPGPAARDAEGGGFGLKAMRERIEELSGTLLIRSEPGAGTTVSARVPHATAGVGA